MSIAPARKDRLSEELGQPGGGRGTRREEPLVGAGQPLRGVAEQPCVGEPLAVLF